MQSQSAEQLQAASSEYAANGLCIRSRRFPKTILILLSQFLLLTIAFLAGAAAQSAPAVLPPAAPFTTPFAAAPPAAFTNFAAPFATAPVAPSLPLPLAISGSQRLDYFNHFNAAFAPPPAARLLATPTGLAALPAFYGFPAAPRFGQPARLLATAPGSVAPFYF